jgi:hypothetical protein
MIARHRNDEDVIFKISLFFAHSSARAINLVLSANLNPLLSRRKRDRVRREIG